MKNMDLYFNEYGSGFPIIIVHGLLGTSDNWITVAKKLSDEYSVFNVDVRNHGRSPHLPEMNYPAMAADLKAFMENQWIHKAHLIGHSMGGKLVMQFALDYPDVVEKLVVVDIAPKTYPGGHEHILEALESIDLNDVASREEVEAELTKRLDEPKSVIQFLMKNLHFDRVLKNYSWKMNLSAIIDHYEEISGAIESGESFMGPSLFISGGNSKYILPKDEPGIKKLFPKAEFQVIENAGHWVHAEKPEEIYKILKEFLKD
jgi:esterase